jgi:ADP-heptose:LPS heptosyltransferase
MAGAASSPVLVIKLGALGDFVQALGPFAAIRRHHANGRVTLLTTVPFRDFAEASGYFDDVWDFGRPAVADIAGWLKLRRRLRAAGFRRVYDLQTSDRSSFYFRLFWPGPYPQWSGIARGCSHPHTNAGRDRMHTVERQAEQLAIAGISVVPAADLSWAGADLAHFRLAERFLLLAPGGAAHRPAKRWPPENFGALAKAVSDRGIATALIGAKAEADVMAAVRAVSPDALDLSGKTNLFDLVALGRRAVAAVGNDTGPMHLIAGVGCRAVVLYSDESDPALCGQRGSAVTILRRQFLAELAVSEVLGALDL